MYRQRGNAGRFSHLRDDMDIFVIVVPAQAGFQGNRHIHRFDHCIQNIGHQRLVLQQSAAGEHIAHFFGGAAHIDIDHLRALRHVITRGFGQLRRLAAGNLHHAHALFSFKIAAAQGFAGMAQRRVAGEHFTHRPAGTECAAKLAERLVGDAGHRCKRDGRVNGISADLHNGRIFSGKGGDCTIFKQRLQSEIGFLHATDILLRGKNGRANMIFIWPRYIKEAV